MNAIDLRIHQALDGELAPAALSAELRRAVERLATAADLLAAPLPFPSLESRVMTLIRRPVPSRVGRVVRWLARMPNPNGLVVSERNTGPVRRRWSVWHSRARFLAYDVRDLPSAFAARQRYKRITPETNPLR